MPDAQPLRQGDPQRLGAYTVTGRLGEGGQGVVYLGESESGERVAVKVLRADLAHDERARGRFLREAVAAKRVARFCTAQVLEAGVDGERPYIVSEYVPGPSLQKLVAESGPRTGGDLERLAIGTVTALVAIHQADIVHRDFKPHNVLMAPDGPRVIDFGIARALDTAATMTNTTVGTPAYMAPEQVAGRDITPAADIFSWASTMVFAATGASPFGHDTVMAVIHRIANEPPELGELAEPLRGIIADCLAKDPADRPETRPLLLRLLGEEGVTPARPTAPVAGAGEATAVDSTAVLAQGAAFATREGATAEDNRGMGAASTTRGGSVPGWRRLSWRALAAAVAGLAVAAALVVALVWAASRDTKRVPGPAVTVTTSPTTSAAEPAPTTREPTRQRPTTTEPTPTSSRPTVSHSVPHSPTAPTGAPSSTDRGDVTPRPSG